MIQVPVRVRRHTALAAFIALTGQAAHAGVVGLPQWGSTPGAAHPTAVDAARCLELEEATARGRGGVRFQMNWSRDASCQGVPSVAATAPAQGGAVPPSPTPQHASPPATSAPFVPPVPAPAPAPAPVSGPATAAPAPTPTPEAGPPQATPAPALVTAPSLPPAPAAPQAPEGPADTPTGPATPPDQDATPPTPAPEGPAPEDFVPSPEQPQGSIPGPGVIDLANELTGIAPPPIAELQAPPHGTIPEPSSLWLLALGVAAAWQSRRRVRVQPPVAAAR